MEKRATSLFRSAAAKAIRGERAAKLDKALFDEVEGPNFVRERYLRIQKDRMKNAAKLKSTARLADGKLAKKARGAVRDIKKKFSASQFFSGSSQAQPRLATA